VPGDVLVWENGRWGHVALVTAVTSSYVDVIEQNVNGNGKSRLTHARGRIGSRPNGWAPTGWVHAKDNRGAAAVDAGAAGGDGAATGSCGSVDDNGIVVAADRACFALGGTPSHLHAERGQGYAGDLVWTHTTDDSGVDHSATWTLNVARVGTYRVEAFVDADVAAAEQAKDRVRHGGTTSDVVRDQSARGGWRSLGEFAFVSGGDQRGGLGDNTGGYSTPCG